MTPEAFIAKWQATNTKERSASQEHFLDLCRVLGEPTPNEADPDGSWYCFERGATKTGGGNGWADVWKKGCFGWEYKGKGRDLRAALRQLQLYALALESPPLLIVSDMESIHIHTAFTNAVPETYSLALEDLADPARLRWLKWAFSDPERLRPGKTVPQLTEEAAGRFAELAESLRKRGHAPDDVAHFLNKLLFCLFAEDVELLPRQLFTRLLENGLKAPDYLASLLKGLFSAMSKGGPFGVEVIDWFNGGLFDGDETLPMERGDIQILLDAARLDWSSIEPSIFGTLFERGLDPAKRSQLGAHYTDRESIMRLIGPAILEPLLEEWEAAKGAITKDQTKGRKKAFNAYIGFLERLRTFRVLDPACGSGNFLYLALLTLKDLEHRVNLEAEALGLPRQFPSVGPEGVHGIEINPFAAELARVTVWIGEIQWMLKHGYSLNRNPILRPLKTIEQRDALINDDGTEAVWPAADAIVGNPPFLGDKKMLGELGAIYVKSIRDLYKGRVPGGADFVTYWFEKARAQIEAGLTQRAGLVATNSIRGGANRKVLDRICATGRIFNAWSDEPWINDGAAVRVSLLCFDADSGEAILDNDAVPLIHADLTGGVTSPTDLTKAIRLKENENTCFEGIKKYGNFDISGAIARRWLAHAGNPTGKSNAEVLRPWINASDVVRRTSDTWVIDFTELTLEQAACFEHPFEHVLKQVKPDRDKDRNARTRQQWWLFERPRLQLRSALMSSSRHIVTPVVSKHRIFAWSHPATLAMNLLDVIARSDDTTFGILHSRFHELWALGTCTWLGKGNDPRYTPTTTFETFPFPEGLTPNLQPEEYTNPHAETIADAARRLNELRENWLNPPDWVERVPEVVSGYPDRILPKPGHESDLKQRTLTNLYNQRPAWLDHAHKALDVAVASSYGWDDYTSNTSDQEILRRLLALNHERSKP